MSRPLRAARSAVLTTVLALAVGLSAVLVGLGVTTAPAQAADTTVIFAVAAPGQTLDEPAVVGTRSGSTLAVWLEQSTVGGVVVRTPQLRRNVTGVVTWAPVALPLAGLDSVGKPFLVQDPATGRVLLTASASRNGALDSTLGTYLWWSGDDGASFTGPIRVHDSFGVGDAAPDGTGGFWTTTGQAGAYIAHITPAYTAEAPLQLTDRVGSRGAIALATGGPAYTPVLAFQAGGTGLWAHRGTTAGQAQDTQLFPTGDGLNVSVVGTPSGVQVAGLHAADGASKALFTRTVDQATGVAGPEQRVSPGDAVFFEVRPRQGNERISNGAVWNDAAGDVYTSLSATATGTWGKPDKVLSGSASGIDYISKPDVSLSYVVGLGNRDSDSAAVVWATLNGPVTDKPTLKAKGASTYSAAKRAISLKLVAGAPGKVTATVLVSGIARKPVRSGSKFTIKAAGKVKQELKVSKKLAAQLKSHPKAKITVKLKIKNVAGKDSATIKVRRR